MRRDSKLFLIDTVEHLAVSLHKLKATLTSLISNHLHAKPSYAENPAKTCIG